MSAGMIMVVAALMKVVEEVMPATGYDAARKAVWGDLSEWPPERLSPCSIVLKQIEDDLAGLPDALLANASRALLVDASEEHGYYRGDLVKALDERATPRWMRAREINRERVARVAAMIDEELSKQGY